MNTYECPGCGTTSTAAHACPGREPYYSETLVWDPDHMPEMYDWLCGHRLSFMTGAILWNVLFQGERVVVFTTAGLPGR